MKRLPRIKLEFFCSYLTDRNKRTCCISHQHNAAFHKRVQDLPFSRGNAFRIFAPVVDCFCRNVWKQVFAVVLEPFCCSFRRDRAGRANLTKPKRVLGAVYCAYRLIVFLTRRILTTIFLLLPATSIAGGPANICSHSGSSFPKFWSS